MIIVQLGAFNEEKRADRLHENEMVIYQGRIGHIKSVEFVDGVMGPEGNVTVVIAVTHKSGSTSPIAHTDEIKTTVPRTAIFNVVGIVNTK